MTAAQARLHPKNQHVRRWSEHQHTPPHGACAPLAAHSRDTHDPPPVTLCTRRPCSHVFKKGERCFWCTVCVFRSSLCWSCIHVFQRDCTLDNVLQLFPRTRATT